MGRHAGQRGGAESTRGTQRTSATLLPCVTGRDSIRPRRRPMWHVNWARDAALWVTRRCSEGLSQRGRIWWASAWSWCSELSSCFLVRLSALVGLRAEWAGAAGAVAETWSGGGPRPPARAARGAGIWQRLHEGLLAKLDATSRSAIPQTRPAVSSPTVNMPRPARPRGARLST